MEKDTEVLVIGAGVVGICTAYYLAEQGCKVTLIDKGEVGSGCSSGNAGLVVPGHCMPMATPGIIAKGLKWMLNPDSPFYIKFRCDRDLMGWLWRFRNACNHQQMRRSIPILHELNLSSFRLYEEFFQIQGMDFGFEQKGLLIVCKTEPSMKAAIQESEYKQQYNITSKILDGPQARQLEPSLRKDVVGAVHFLQDAHLDPGRFISQAALLVREKGGKIFTGTEVIGFKAANSKILTVKTIGATFQPMRWCWPEGPGRRVWCGN